MTVLGIDTATTTASVALVNEGSLILEETYPSPAQSGKFPLTSNRANHAEIVLPLVEGLLKRSGLTLPELSALAVSIGPGSFTGLRIGLSTVKGLAYGWNVPVVGVSTLFAMAARVTDWDGLICPFLDARKKEVYTALLSKKAEGLERLTEDVVSSPNRIIQHIQSINGQKPCLFIGDGTRVYGDLIKKGLGDQAILSLGESFTSTAAAVARLGEGRVLKNESDPLGSLAPVYLRPSEAELKKGV